MVTMIWVLLMLHDGCPTGSVRSSYFIDSASCEREAHRLTLEHREKNITYVCMTLVPQPK